MRHRSVDGPPRSITPAHAGLRRVSIDDEDGSSTPKPATDAVAANDAPRYGSRPRPRQGMKRLTPPSRPFEGIRNPTGRERRRSVMTAPPRKPDTARVRPTYPRLVHNLLG